MNAITFARYPTDYERDALQARATDRRFIGAVLIALLLLIVGMAGCKASPTVIAATTTTATVQTIDAGIDAFTAWATTEEHAIADAVVAKCHDQACADGIVKPRRAPIDKATTAIKVYRGLIATGSDVDAGKLAAAATDVVTALAAVGIKVTP